MLQISFKKHSHFSDEELMQRICRRDRRAFELLYDRYFLKMVRFCEGLLESRERAEDMVQETFIRIIERPDAFNTEQKFSTWVYTIAANLCRNELRNTATRSRLLQENHAGLTPDQHTTVQHNNIDLEKMKARIREVFTTLSQKEKSIWVLRFEHELSIKEIAGILDIPEGSVKSGVYYLLKKIAEPLSPFKNQY